MWDRMSSANRFVEASDLSTILTHDLLRLVSFYISILFHINLYCFSFTPESPPLGRSNSVSTPSVQREGSDQNFYRR